MSPEPDPKNPQDPEVLKKKLEDYLSEGAPEIPQPEPKREKEEEKKKGGVALPAGSGAGSSGAGIGASASGSAGLGELAGIVIRGASPVGAGAPMGMGAAGFFGKLGALFMSKGAAVLIAAAIVAGAGAVMAKHRPSASQSPTVRRMVADLRSAIPVHKVSQDLSSLSLSLLAQAVKKEFGGGVAAESPGAAGPTPDVAASVAGRQAAGGAGADAGGASPGVLAEGDETGSDGKKLVQPRLKSSGLGGFGSHNIFSGGGAATAAPKFGDGFDRGKIIGFQSPQKSKAKGGHPVAGAPMGSPYARVKGLDKNSRSLAQLRGMRTMNPSLRAGGARASEANKDASIAQFEGTRLDGAGAGSVPDLPDDASTAQVPATPAGVGNTGSTTGTTATDANPVDTCTDQQYWDGSACKSIYTTDPGQNSTPWQDKANQAKDLILAGCALGLLATIFYKIYDKLKDKPYPVSILAYVCLIIAIVCLLAAIACAIAAISLGSQINSMGGSPQGTLDMVAGVAVIIGTLAAMFGEGNVSTYAAVVLAILFICELVSKML
ncbi:MAG: hypothetical protein NTY77_02140 [Elusimicrobia bacterium]|nr:hypothetical protein [Elusimicrobiota bacterium]